MDDPTHLNYEQLSDDSRTLYVSFYVYTAGAALDVRENFLVQNA